MWGFYWEIIRALPIELWQVMGNWEATFAVFVAFLFLLLPDTLWEWTTERFRANRRRLGVLIFALLCAYGALSVNYKKFDSLQATISSLETKLESRRNEIENKSETIANLRNELERVKTLSRPFLRAEIVDRGEDEYLFPIQKPGQSPRLRVSFRLENASDDLPIRKVQIESMRISARGVVEEKPAHFRQIDLQPGEVQIQTLIIPVANTDFRRHPEWLTSSDEKINVQAVFSYETGIDPKARRRLEIEYEIKGDEIYLKDQEISQ